MIISNSNAAENMAARKIASAVLPVGDNIRRQRSGRNVKPDPDGAS